MNIDVLESVEDNFCKDKMGGEDKPELPKKSYIACIKIDNYVAWFYGPPPYFLINQNK